MKHVTFPLVMFLLLVGIVLADEPSKPEAAAAAVTEIGQQRTPCFGTCPIYTVNIKADGTFVYRGQEYVEHKGDWTGSLPKGEFEKLAHLVIAADFAKLNDDYKPKETITDLPTWYTTAVIDGKKKTIKDYAHAAPEALRQLEEATAAAMDHARWDREEEVTGVLDAPTKMLRGIE